MYLEKRFLKAKFDQYVAAQKLVEYEVYGSEYSIKLDLEEIRKRSFSVLLGCYVNEKKAVIEDGWAYLAPEYDKYQTKILNYKKQKLLQYVKSKNFIAMLGQAQIVTQKFGKCEKEFYYKLSQNDAMRYQCMIIVGLLIDESLATINEVSNDIYIFYNYQQKLEKTSKIQSDLSHFRTLIGECNNLATLLQLVEKGEFEDNKLCISWKDIEEAEMKTEIMSLIDIGIAVFDNEKKRIQLEVGFASWLLDYTSKTSDRISFADMYIG